MTQNGRGSPTGVKTRPQVDPRISARRAAEARRVGRRRLRRIVVALGVVVVLVLAVVLLRSPLFSARVVTVEGPHPHTSTAAIVRAAGVVSRPPLISVDPSVAAAAVERLPWVGKATVARSWPDGVVITVTERRPVATMSAPGGRAALVDATGRTLEVVASRPSGLPALVIHQGGSVLAPAAVAGFLPTPAGAALDVAATLPPAFSAQVIQVVGSAGGTVELDLNSGLTVLLGNATDLSTKYHDVASIIAAAPLKGAHTIDVTVPSAPVVS